MGRGIDYTRAESLDRSGQELTEAEREQLEKLLDTKKTKKNAKAATTNQ
ncbi:hypothetical protein [Microtetraspora malaysiensis]|uniref:Uncharacterized protein n=1 Tax=Microtetraspora malaysiensis TaxID=161358 RepID=A0ABW6T1L8_9ACTN